MAARRYVEVGTELVDERWACPYCCEQRMDWLVPDDDGEHVDCQTCGTRYTLRYSEEYHGRQTH